MTSLVVVVHDAGNPALGVVLQLLAGPAHALHAPLGPGEVILILHTAAHAVYPLEQTARPVVGVALEYMAVRTDHREHPSLGVVGELEALPAYSIYSQLNSIFASCSSRFSGSFPTEAR